MWKCGSAPHVFHFFTSSLLHFFKSTPPHLHTSTPPHFFTPLSYLFTSSLLHVHTFHLIFTSFSPPQNFLLTPHHRHTTFTPLHYTTPLHHPTTPPHHTTPTTPKTFHTPPTRWTRVDERPPMNSTTATTPTSTANHFRLKLTKHTEHIDTCAGNRTKTCMKQNWC